MAFIPYASREELPDRLHQVLIEDPTDNILRIHGLNAPSLRHHLQLYSHLMQGPSPLSRVQREMLAVTISAVNDCFY